MLKRIILSRSGEGYTDVGTSNTNKLNINLAEGSVESADVQKARESKPTPKIEVQPIVMVPQVVEQTAISQKPDQTLESKQTEAPVKSIQEGQAQIEVKPTPPAVQYLSNNYYK